MTRPEGCPEWCNYNHKPGANPRRQRHGRYWRPVSPDSSTVFKVATYAGSGGLVGGPTVSVDVDGYGGLAELPNGRGGVLSVNDVRALAVELLYLAVCADRAQKVYKERRATLARSEP